MVKRLKTGELCAGYGGLALAVEEAFGARTAWFSEFDSAPSKILAHHWPTVPNHGDMTVIDWEAIEQVDIISGGTPCQDLSHAGRRKGMTEGTRSNLWVNMREAIAIQKPAFVAWENVRGAYSACADSEMGQCPGCLDRRKPHRPFLRALGRVLGDLSELGYDTQWRGIRASDVGAPHGRFRVFVLAKRRAGNGSRPADATADADGRRGPESFNQARGRGPGWAPSLADEPGGGPASHGDGPGREQQRGAGAAPKEVPPAQRESAAAENPDLTTGGQWGLTASGQTEDRGPRADVGGRSGTPAANPEGIGRGEGRPESAGILRGSHTAIDRAPAADTAGNYGERRTGLGTEGRWQGLNPATYADATGARCTEGQDGGTGSGHESEGARRGQPERTGGKRIDPASHAGSAAVREYSGGSSTEETRPGSGDGSGDYHGERSVTNWGPYEPAIRRWEQVLGRGAPRPTEPTGRAGGQRLSPRFTEWMMGLPDGWVTDPAIGLGRNEQLKACGNGVVPQQAAAALRDMLAAFKSRDGALW